MNLKVPQFDEFVNDWKRLAIADDRTNLHDLLQKEIHERVDVECSLISLAMWEEQSKDNEYHQFYFSIEPSEEIFEAVVHYSGIG